MARSRRPSGRKPASSSPSPPELFCDRSLGARVVPTRLRQLHGHVVAHDEVFGRDTDDEVWLREAGRRSWIVLTRDDRIRYRPGERAAILGADVRCFVLNPTKGMTGEDMATALATALPRILAISAAERGPFIKGVNRRGQIRNIAP
ncbi:MAG: hypothetical protein WD770_11010 [Actinomycetota bacterium]